MAPNLSQMSFNIPYFQVLGVVLIVLGFLVFAAPFLLDEVPSLEKIPWIILYVYRSDGFTFITLPILIIVSILFFLLSIIFVVRS